MDRICFVTPFAWSQPHEVNAHVEGTAAALRRLGHDVTVLAPSSRARDLLAGRRALQRGTDEEVIAVGPSIRSPRTNMGVPVAARKLASRTLPRPLRRRARLRARASESLLSRTDVDPCADGGDLLLADRLAYPPRRSRRDRLRARVDASSQRPSDRRRSRGAFRGRLRAGSDRRRYDALSPGEKRRTIAVELEPAGRGVTRESPDCSATFPTGS